MEKRPAPAGRLFSGDWLPSNFLMAVAGLGYSRSRQSRPNSPFPGGIWLSGQIFGLRIAWFIYKVL